MFKPGFTAFLLPLIPVQSGCLLTAGELRYPLAGFSRATAEQLRGKSFCKSLSSDMLGQVRSVMLKQRRSDEGSGPSLALIYSMRAASISLPSVIIFHLGRQGYAQSE